MSFGDVHTLALKAARNENLSVLPEIARQVITLSNDVNTPAHYLEKLISKDVALATKIIKVANSSYYGSRNLSSIGRAIAVLGFSAVRSVAVTLVYQQAISFRPSAPNFNLAQFWSHSLATAVGARALAQAVLPEAQDELYVGGMLHDVGMLIMDRFEPTVFSTSLKVAKEQNRPVYQVENELTGYNHALLGGLVAQKWDFSPLLVSMIGGHHDISSVNEAHRKPVAILMVANDVARNVGLNNQSIGDAITPEIFDISGVKEEHIEDAKGLIMHEILSVQKFLLSRAA
jgi:HD-like signal output (HDOD) protein